MISEQALNRLADHLEETVAIGTAAARVKVIGGVVRADAAYLIMRIPHSAVNEMWRWYPYTGIVVLAEEWT